MRPSGATLRLRQPDRYSAGGTPRLEDQLELMTADNAQMEVNLATQSVQLCIA